jgi:glycosyltransferase involved in cell wall biosynthesis
MTVCIPTHEMHGLGARFLEQSFEVLGNQTFKDFEVIISDHSIDDSILDVCSAYKDILNINYLRNSEKRGSISANSNNAIRHARGKIIKILYMDDFLFHKDALQDISRAFDLEKDHWLLTGCEHTKDGTTFYHPFYPRYYENIHIGENTISSPSVLTIKNDHPLFFDENLQYRCDSEYYKRYYDTYGEPNIVRSINVVNRVSIHQTSQTSTHLNHKEVEYIKKKYGLTARSDSEYASMASISAPGELYYNVIEKIGALVSPKTYLEIGVAQGNSISLMPESTLCIGIDPQPDIRKKLHNNVKIFRQTSNEFFMNIFNNNITIPPIDLAFIDGMHLFDFVLNEFLRCEVMSQANTIFLIHDCIPLDEITSSRNRTTSWWTGDVWKAVLCLKKWRPDLLIATLDCYPTGLGMIRNVNPKSPYAEHMRNNLNSICEEMRYVSFSELKKEMRTALNIIATEEGLDAIKKSFIQHT